MIRASLLLAAALFAAGCASIPVSTESTDGLNRTTRRARLESLSGWDMRGRLAIDTGERAFQARFRWLQESDSLVLTVRGFLGAGSFEISGNEKALALRARGESLALTDPEIELSNLYGWWLPVSSLNAWLIGLADTRFEARTRFESDGTLAALEQRLWVLEYADYGLAEGILLPRRIDMTHGPLQLRLTVDSWNPLDSTNLALN
jgi:outer membrane lipoprotein LolB